MDVRMPVMDGLEALRAIAEEPALSATRVVVLTTFELDEYVFEALRAGASGFLIKDTDPGDILRAIRVVTAGESLLSPAVTRPRSPRTGSARSPTRTTTSYGTRSWSHWTNWFPSLTSATRAAGRSPARHSGSRPP